MAGSLRSFRDRDADAIVELSRLATARPELQVGNPIWATREELESELSDWSPPPGETLYVFEEDGRVAGFGGVELPRGFDHAELFGPLVAPAARGHKVGSALLEAALERARASGAPSLFGAVGTQNTATRILLERHGFLPHGAPQATFRLRTDDHRPAQPVPGVEVRRAEGSDLEGAVALYRACFPGGRFTSEVWRANVERGTVYLAEDANRLVGVLNIDPSDRWIYHVAVDEQARNRGVGAYLLSRSLEDYWSRHPGETLGLDVDADNVAAIRLYRRQGFAPWLVLQTFELKLSS